MSRRFSSDIADTVYSIASPILGKFGQPVECRNANDTLSSQEYWIARMGLILDCSPIHFLLDIDRSKSTIFEYEYSNLSTYFDKKDYLVALFDCRPLHVQPPVRIIVQEKGSSHPTPTLYSNKLRKKLFSKSFTGSDIFLYYDQQKVEKFEKNLERALSRASEAVANRYEELAAIGDKELRIRIKHHANRYPYFEEGNFVDARDHFLITRSIMRYIGLGLSVEKIQREIAIRYEENIKNLDEMPSYNFKAWKVRSRKVIGDLNSILTELVNNLYALGEKPRNIKLFVQYVISFVSTKNLNPDFHLYDVIECENLLLHRIKGMKFRDTIGLDDQEYEEKIFEFLEKNESLMADFRNNKNEIRSARVRTSLLYLHGIKVALSLNPYKIKAVDV